MIYTKDNYVLSSGESYEQSHIMSEKIVFIHSLGRSGSTFLQKLFVDLGGSDFYCYPKEWNVMEKYHRALDADGMQVLGQLVEMYREDSKSDKKIVELLDALASSELEKKVTVCEFLGVIKQLVSAGNDNSFMIIKTTDLDNYWLYVKYMPSSKSIINIRNPLDYIHSWHMFWMRSNYPIWPTHWDRPLHVEALERLKACFLQAWVYRSMENVRIVKMEEIESFDDVDSYNKRNSQIVGIARTRAVP